MGHVKERRGERERSGTRTWVGELGWGTGVKNCGGELVRVRYVKGYVRYTGESFGFFVYLAKVDGLV